MYYILLHITYLYEAATKEFESESEGFTDSSSPLVTCALSMVKIMTEVEPLLQ